jgi:hypothetical protein
MHLHAKVVTENVAESLVLLQPLNAYLQRRIYYTNRTPTRSRADHGHQRAMTNKFNGVLA